MQPFDDSICAGVDLNRNFNVSNWDQVHNKNLVICLILIIVFIVKHKYIYAPEAKFIIFQIHYSSLL